MTRRAALASALLRATARPLLGPPVPLGVQRAFLEATARGVPLPRGTTVRASVLGGRPAEVVAAPGAAGAPVLLVHGGGFITCSPRTHRAFAAHLSRASGRPVHVQDHRLAPEHPHPAALDDTLAALRELGPQALLVGDSAGGFLALSALLRLRDEGGQLPARGALVSPLVDVTLASARAWTGRDPLLRMGWLEAGTGAYLAGADPVALSPLYADLAGLPPLLVHVSEHERLRPEGEELVRRVQAAGGSAELHLVPGVWHDAHLQAGLVLVPEADEAVRLLGSWLVR